MNQETVEFVNNCILSFFGICLIFIIGIFLWWFIPLIIREIKDYFKIKKIRKENFSFIKKYEHDNPPTKAYKDTFDWEWKHHYRDNYEKFRWCSMCKYWVEIEEGDEYEYCRGICKIRYKQYMNVEQSTTTNDWCCKYYSL
jgi:hypothetical protein